jgi:hypothetical protein
MEEQVALAHGCNATVGQDTQAHLLSMLINVFYATSSSQSEAQILASPSSMRGYP